MTTLIGATSFEYGAAARLVELRRQMLRGVSEPVLPGSSAHLWDDGPDGGIAIAVVGGDPAASLSVAADAVLLGDVTFYDDDLRTPAGRLGDIRSRGIPRALDDLHADFALARWDREARRLVLARDPFGIRAIHWAWSGDCLCFATRVGPLLALDAISVEVEPETILECLAYDYRASTRSFFRGVSRVEAGHWVELSPHRSNSRRYYLPSPHLAPIRSEAEFAEEGVALFRRAVRGRLRGAGPTVLGHLSGGLDSSSIVVTADRLLSSEDLGCRFVAVSAVFPGLACDESERIRAVIRKIHAEHRVWPGIDPGWAVTDARPHLDMPTALFRRVGGSDGDLAIARELGASVILSGEGGDEAGAWTAVLLDLFDRGRWPRLAWELAAFGRTPDRFTFLAKFVLGHAHSRIRRLGGRRSPGSEPPAWLGDTLRPLWQRRALELAPNQSFAFSSELQRQVWGRTTHPRIGRFLDAERVAAADARMQYRYPFFDRRFVDWVLAAPPLMRLPGGRAKPLHHKLFRSILPASYLHQRRDTGFTSGLIAEMHMARERVGDIVGGREWHAGGLLDQRQLRHDFDRLLARAAPEAQMEMMAWWRLREAVKLELWLRRVIAGKRHDSVGDDDGGRR